jgi:hypothetical protein
MCHGGCPSKMPIVIPRLSKEGCISLVVGRRAFCATSRHDLSQCGPPSTWEKYFSKTGLSKIRNLEHKYKATTT